MKQEQELEGKVKSTSAPQSVFGRAVSRLTGYLYETRFSSPERATNSCISLLFSVGFTVWCAVRSLCDPKNDVVLVKAYCTDGRTRCTERGTTGWCAAPLQAPVLGAVRAAEGVAEELGGPGPHEPLQPIGCLPNQFSAWTSTEVSMYMIAL